MVDCAEGTLRQFALQPYGKSYLKSNKITKLFITHMHGTLSEAQLFRLSFVFQADHVMGIVPLLRNLLYPPTTTNLPTRLTKSVCSLTLPLINYLNDQLL